jgi:exopolyphosphatase / guanosine-5'-triphosphate,3'-diphosphate pyrophosphatase
LTFRPGKNEPSGVESSKQLSPSKNAPFAIVDIGSNSVRLVVYEGAKRNPVPIFNEKILAGLGGRLSETGKLDPEGCERALKALKRFWVLLAQMNVGHVEMVATAAVRDAKDSAEFTRAVKKATGHSVRVLSGKEEAKYAAMGVLSGTPDADGIVGDLGGGSLELVDVKNGIMGEGATLPLGPLRLLGDNKKSLTEVLAGIDTTLETVKWIGQGKRRTLYAVGGVWRNLARIHMAQKKYPIRVLHNYMIPAAEAVELAGLIEQLGSKTLAKIPDVSSRRVGALPIGAHVLSQLIAAAQVKWVSISAYGVREGLLYEQLSKQEKKRDPLLAGAEDLAKRLVRFPEHNQELVEWTAPIFDKGGLSETAAQERLRNAACILADIGWYVHPDYRAAYAHEQVLLAPISGLTHAERLFLACVGFHRHEGAAEPDIDTRLQRLLDEEGHMRARITGLALRLAFTLCAASVGVLPHTKVVVTDDTLRLEIQKSHKAFLGEVVEKRLTALAKAMGRKSETRVL